jgi:hypothetical protein
MVEKLNRHAKALAKVGASKGGKARAAVLTPEERKEIARKAIRTRWAKKKGVPLEEYPEQVSDSLDQVWEMPKKLSSPIQNEPVSLYQGELKIGDIAFSCHVLNDLRRVLAQREVVGVLTGNKKGGLARYLKANALQEYIDVEKISGKTIEFVIPGTQYKAIGCQQTHYPTITFSQTS